MSSNSSTGQRVGSIFFIFLRLGLTSFGGPVAHLGFFRDEFVKRRAWLSESNYAELIALCQFLPGPASSQVGMALGLLRGGYAGALAAWLGFTLPSALLLIVFALGLQQSGAGLNAGFIHGLQLVAVAVVAQAIWGMARQLCRGVARSVIMFAAAALALSFTWVGAQVLIMMGAATIGTLLFKPISSDHEDALRFPVSLRMAQMVLLAFIVLLLGLPWLAQHFAGHSAALIDAFFRAGSLVFGGGHVVLPLLESEVVATGWVSPDTFLAGYGAAQAVPGPLFTFAAFLGAAMPTTPNGWVGGVVAVIAIFLPSFLLVIGAIPFWGRLRQNTRAQAALIGVNAAVVGLLLAAFYRPVWLSTIHGLPDLLGAAVAFVALSWLRCPPWLVVVLGGVVGAFLFSSVPLAVQLPQLTSIS
ncbi:chromate efflux transporter [Paenalcaligenes hominis]|uniref:chromate efflux transporter n=1 Tax=Paenalcaligenes hominis TaxID=643674 RepID=UPI003524715C